MQRVASGGELSVAARRRRRQTVACSWDLRGGDLAIAGVCNWVSFDSPGTFGWQGREKSRAS
jgi:hypothetical protein